jgi:hypothetical protein
MMLRTASGCLALLLCVSAWAGECDDLAAKAPDYPYDAEKPYHEMDVATLTQRAEENDPLAQNLLGVWYERGGKGLPKNPEMSVRWHLKAAEQGHGGAAANVAGMYIRGDGFPKDGAAALKWVRIAAAQGHRGGYYWLGYMNALGIGVAKNSPEAERCYLYAARQGHTQAQSNLAYMYRVGDGIAANPEQAFTWSTRAKTGATQGEFWTESPWNVLPPVRDWRSEVLACQHAAARRADAYTRIWQGESDDVVVGKLVEKKLPRDAAQDLVLSLRQLVDRSKAAGRAPVEDMEAGAYGTCVVQKLSVTSLRRARACGEHVALSRSAYGARADDAAQERFQSKPGQSAAQQKSSAELLARARASTSDEEGFVHQEGMSCLGVDLAEKGR